ncbi:MAG TPA: anti-sigma factor [Gemmatimonadaceae bacterium]|nr:anti-sigma factor [Gemmatimonadaceae bacterium]
MSTPNEMDEAFVALPELALGMLPAAEAERLMAIVRTSPRLQAELASLRGATDALAVGVPAVPMAMERKSAMRDRLMARAAGGDASTAAPHASSPTVSDTPQAAAQVAPTLRLERRDAERPVIREVQVPARLSLIQRASPFLAIAATALFVVSAFRLRDTMQERNDAQVALREATATTTALQGKLAVSDSLVTAMSGANVRVVELASTQQMSPGAKMFWDRVANRWTLVTHDLKPVPSGRTYQLWLVTAKAEKISAGTFNTDERGRAVVQATYALAEADLAAIAITEEPTGGSPQPTGTILVAGAPTR